MIERYDAPVFVNDEFIGYFDVVINDCEARLYRNSGLDRVIQFDSMEEYNGQICLYKSSETTNYYKPHDTEAWDLIDQVLTYYGSDLTGGEPFYIGNIMKYLLRYKYKGKAEEDINKLIRYAQKLK